jgi:DNA-binding NtrC family response regulator
MNDVAAAQVMVVDDELVVRRTLVRAITRAGYACVAVADVPEAMSCFADGQRPGVVISDFHLPGESGVDLAHYIARIAPGTPVLITSGASHLSLDGDPTVAGFIEKPFELHRLTSAIADALKLAR